WSFLGTGHLTCVYHGPRRSRLTAHRLLRRRNMLAARQTRLVMLLGTALMLVLMACQPAAQSPPAAPAKPTEAAKPAAPAASPAVAAPAAAPAAPAAASPAAAGAGLSGK